MGNPLWYPSTAISSASRHSVLLITRWSDKTAFSTEDARGPASWADSVESQDAAESLAKHMPGTVSVVSRYAENTPVNTILAMVALFGFANVAPARLGARRSLVTAYECS